MSLTRQVPVGEKSRLAPVRPEVLSWLIPALENAKSVPLVGLLAQKNR